MKTIKFTLVATTLAILTACSASKEQCDPSKSISFIDKIACSTSGTYDERVSDKEKELAQAQDQKQRLDKEYSQTKAKVKKSKQDLANKNAELAKLNKSTQSYAEQLKAKAKGKADVLSQIDNIEKQLKQVSSSGLSEAQQQAKIQELQRKLQALQKATGI